MKPFAIRKWVAMSLPGWGMGAGWNWHSLFDFTQLLYLRRRRRIGPLC